MYRYSAQKHNTSLLAIGVIRIGTLYDFRRIEHHKGIADPQEGKKEVFHHIDKLFVNDPNDTNIKDNTDFRALDKFGAVRFGSNSKNALFQNCTVSKGFDVPDCFIYCTSKVCSKETMIQFDRADSCIEIIGIESFYRILTNVLNSITPVDFKGFKEVTYQNRVEQWNGIDWGNHPAFIKEPRFKKQSELRAIWQPLCKNRISPIITGDYRLGKYCRNVSI